MTTRRNFLKIAVGAAALGAAGYGWAKPKLVNPCRAGLPPELAASPWLQQVWQGLDPAELWDCHVHLAGLGDGGSGIAVGPHLKSPLHPWQYLQRMFYMNAGCANRRGQVDFAYVDRLRNLVDAMPKGFKVMLFAFDRFHDENGQAQPKRSAFYIPDAWAEKQAREFPQGFEWVASIHPYRADAIDALNAAHAGGARAVKWLPAAQGMDPGSPRCDAFFKTAAALKMPLIIHCGEEKAVAGGETQAYGNPLRLRRALDAGARIVVAHCASLGTDLDTDQGSSGARVASFDLFARMMDEPRAKGLLRGDISAVIQRNREPQLIRTLLERSDWHDRLLHGSDYPLPGILPLILPERLAAAGLLPKEAVADLQRLREHNPLYFDFAVKRLLNWQGKTFAPQVFATRRFFERGNA